MICIPSPSQMALDLAGVTANITASIEKTVEEVFTYLIIIVALVAVHALYTAIHHVWMSPALVHTVDSVKAAFNEALTPPSGRDPAPSPPSRAPNTATQ